MQYVSPTLGALIISTIPLFVPIADIIIFKSRITVMNYIGILISISGVIFVVFSTNSDFSASMMGIAWLFLSVIAAIVYTSILYKLSDKYQPISIVAYQNLIGILYFMPLLFLTEYSHLVQVQFSFEVFKPLIQLVIFGSILAFLFYSYSVKHLGMTKSTIFTNLIPVFTAVFALFMHGSPITLFKGLGITLVIGGLLTSQFSKKTSTN